MKKYEKKASFTLEATIIMPIVFVTVLLVIYYGFLLHDYCLADAYGYLAAEEGRMASIYGKIPNDAAVLKEGFKDEESVHKAEKAIGIAYGGIVKNTMAGLICRRNVQISKDASVSKLTYKPGVFRYVPGKIKPADKTVKTTKECNNGVLMARITTVIYRLIKKIFLEK